MIFNNSGGSGNAKGTKYDNTESGLQATNVQEAVDELNSSLTLDYSNASVSDLNTFLQIALEKLCPNNYYIIKDGFLQNNINFDVYYGATQSPLMSTEQGDNYLRFNIHAVGRGLATDDITVSGFKYIYIEYLKNDATIEAYMGAGAYWEEPKVALTSTSKSVARLQINTESAPLISIIGAQKDGYVDVYNMYLSND